MNTRPTKKERESSMATKTSYRRKHQRKAKMLAAAVRRAEKRNDAAGAVWAAIQLEMQTGQKIAERAR